MTRQQAHCRHCRAMTLHERDPSSVNHVLHLLATVFLCGLWLPIWILFAVFAPDRRIRCLACGFALGDETWDDKERRRLADERLAAQNRAARRDAVDHTLEVTKATGQSVGQIVVWILEAVGFAILSAFASGVAAVQQVDAILWKLSGEDRFMLWFCRCLLALAMIGAATGAIYTGVRLAL